MPSATYTAIDMRKAEACLEYLGELEVVVFLRPVHQATQEPQKNTRPKAVSPGRQRGLGRLADVTADFRTLTGVDPQPFAQWLQANKAAFTPA